MNNKYLIRLDDACPTMDKAKWQRIFDILDDMVSVLWLALFRITRIPNRRLTLLMKIFGIRQSSGSRRAMHSFAWL